MLGSFLWKEMRPVTTAITRAASWLASSLVSRERVTGYRRKDPMASPRSGCLSGKLNSVWSQVLVSPSRPNTHLFRLREERQHCPHASRDGSTKTTLTVCIRRPHITSHLAFLALRSAFFSTFQATPLVKRLSLTYTLRQGLSSQ